VAVGWRFLDVREMMDGDGRGGAVRWLEEIGERGKESDLKNCSRWPKTEYVRPYSCRCMGTWVSHAFECMQASLNACMQCSACVMGRCGRTHKGIVERSAVYMFECIGVRSNAKSN
jgi:hypothetical protein